MAENKMENKKRKKRHKKIGWAGLFDHTRLSS